ncbi:helix-turn-helix domain-containing protein [Streptomyces regalis]|uniref:DNA-binding protein n=1 Tax=Streptomyces regalis TaxID=68262 RepID=A0A101JG61_9ACTN|nr:helix-turn-helix transcriptional regulator [Streptomyces regalis]KUL26233.1 DNA-binding protein [Streptomyces regalis]
MTASRPTQGNSTTTVLGRRLGGELIKLRTAAGLTQTHAAKALTASTTKIAKMEGGWVPVRDPDIRALCELYGVHDPGVVGGLLELAKVDRERRKAKGWWNDHAINGVMQEYVTLESVATAIKMWQPSFVPGLLQTPVYVRALTREPTATTARTRGPEEEFVAARLARQQRLSNDPPLSLHTVIYEAVLRNFPGGADTARGQLDHLAQMADLPNITLQIYPFSGGTHLGLNGSFNIISFTEPGAMDIVYAEAPFTQRWVEGGEGAAAYDELFEMIADRALGKRESASFLRRLRKEL